MSSETVQSDSEDSPAAWSGDAVRFFQKQFWRPSGIPPALYCVLLKHTALPVTLLCGRDTASRAAERTMQDLLGLSPWVNLRIQHFGEGGYGVNELLAEHVLLVVIRYREDGLAAATQARQLIYDFQDAAGMVGGTLSGRVGDLLDTALCALKAYAVLGSGSDNPLDALMLAGRTAATAVDTGCENVGGERLHSLTTINERTSDVEKEAIGWATVTSAKVVDWALGKFTKTGEGSSAHEWNLEDLELQLGVTTRKWVRGKG